MKNQCHTISEVTGSNPVPPTITVTTLYRERRF